MILHTFSGNTKLPYALNCPFLRAVRLRSFHFTQTRLVATLERSFTSHPQLHHHRSSLSRMSNLQLVDLSRIERMENAFHESVKELKSSIDQLSSKIESSSTRLNAATLREQTLSKLSLHPNSICELELTSLKRMSLSFWPCTRIAIQKTTQLLRLSSSTAGTTHALQSCAHTTRKLLRRLRWSAPYMYQKSQRVSTSGVIWTCRE